MFIQTCLYVLGTSLTFEFPGNLALLNSCDKVHLKDNQAAIFIFSKGERRLSIKCAASQSSPFPQTFPPYCSKSYF